MGTLSNAEVEKLADYYASYIPGHMDTRAEAHSDLAAMARYIQTASAVVEAAQVLHRAGREVSGRGAVPGHQWVKLTSALLHVENALRTHDPMEIGREHV